MRAHVETSVREGPIRAFLVSLLGAATVAVGVVLIRLTREVRADTSLRVSPGVGPGHTVSLERLRELGL